MYDAIVVLISKLGGLGVFLLMFGENLFPPIPSEVILPLAGYTAAQARLAAGRDHGRHAGVGRWCHPLVLCGALDRDRAAQAVCRGSWPLADVDTRRNRSGGQMVRSLWSLGGAVRQAVAGHPHADFGAGWCHRHGAGAILAWTTIGSAAWTAMLAIAGYELGERYGQIATIVEPVSNAVLALAGIWYLWRVATFGRKHR